MKKRTYFAALLPFLILAGMFEILPVFTIIVKSFMPESGDPGFTLQNYINVFSKPLYLTAIKNSLIISVVSAVIGLAVAFVGGRAACEKGGRPKRIFMSVLNMVIQFFRRSPGIFLHYSAGQCRGYHNPGTKPGN